MNYPINMLIRIAVTSAFFITLSFVGASSAQAYYVDSYVYDYSSCGSSCGGSSYYSSPSYYQPSTYYPTRPLPPTQPTVSPLQASCYPQPLTANVGDSATWVSNVFGGTGSYSYSWSGTDGLVGSGPSMSKVYYNSGSKSATMTVTSGRETKSVSCSGSVTVYGNQINYPTYPPVVYNPPVYNPPYNYTQPLSVSCTSNTSATPVGSTVTWTANVVGGSGYYNYTWSGTDGIYGYTQSLSTTYSNPGVKTASVSVYSNGQTITQMCGNSVSIGNYYNYNNTNTYTNYSYSNVNTNNNGLDVGCYADPINASVNQPVTWSVEVVGGVAPYTYSWSGTDGLTGNSSNVIKYYSSNGDKNAVVSVSSADGKTSTRACTNAISVGRSSVGSGSSNTTSTVKTTTTSASNNNLQSAAALFSLQNIPWGWVAILIILVLFATIVYLIYNRPKI